jgi:hypothetical protein
MILPVQAMQAEWVFDFVLFGLVWFLTGAIISKDVLTMSFIV